VLSIISEGTMDSELPANPVSRPRGGIHCFRTRLHSCASKNEHRKKPVRAYSESDSAPQRRGGRKAAGTLYTHVDVYTRRVLDSCLRIRERGETEQTRGSPVPRGLGVLSYLDRAARWQDGRVGGRGVHGRGALAPCAILFSVAFLSRG